ncbi:unnamed protein product [Ectocarpus fasciculatus]
MYRRWSYRTWVHIAACMCVYQTYLFSDPSVVFGITRARCLCWHSSFPWQPFLRYATQSFLLVLVWVFGRPDEKRQGLKTIRQTELWEMRSYINGRCDDCCV